MRENTNSEIVLRPGPTDLEGYLEGYFSQAIEDSGIQHRVSGLRQSIATHVFNYYGELKHPPSNEVFCKAVRLSEEEVRVQRTMPDQESFRLAAIERVIARSSIKKTALDGDPDKTFLPQSLVTLVRMVPRHDNEKCEY